ncbi:hypothetical protein GCM10010174_67750 [Kutzneria viridogrisea]|uniref:Uncharacterized protein n=2 Tax=Kutzneria TaxID=43356 RepID=W5WDT1_9PSEU|nr:hypothetical protein [Kutzneria albida]AHH99012.1 hypothetical protein KALB_5650 [Kutzneria albida DSM 43870]MBA8923432.1 hypothetical protein [Kutzneria viridogrisea]
MFVAQHPLTVGEGGFVQQDTLTAAIRPDAERIAYPYEACARAATCPTLAGKEPLLADRFTGERVPLTESMTCDLAELTAANELDVMTHSTELRIRYAAALTELFRSWERLLSPAARAATADR